MPLLLLLPVSGSIAELEYDITSGGNTGQLAPSGEDKLNVSILHHFKGHKGPVLQCKLTNSELQQFHVVCKFSTNQPKIDAIRNECKIYEQKLRHLQGTIIPRCYGIFQGMMDEKFVVCLVTEYSGTVVKDFYKTDWDFRIDVINALVTVHKAGVRYGRAGRFGESKVLVNCEGRHVLFNLDKAEEHTCEHDSSQITFTAHARCPSGEKFLCTELYDASDRTLDLWEPYYVVLWDRAVPVETMKDMNAVLALAPEGLPHDEAYKEAKPLIDAFMENLGHRRRLEPLVKADDGLIYLTRSTKGGQSINS
ncbi:hypothetical protein CERSUDRAFT_96300 [Gelatoporia subvermispora B]|uniref:Protein kinase domain-containing protein n=1 Tax=Ceriporiopsis subvermispora (strain B) TaxID=914234 RepID=M2QVF2_CERS8|nr:hypothetical protein CERSUDRAFT_96300 [Gelatoporia subvermispora B]